MFDDILTSKQIKVVERITFGKSIRLAIPLQRYGLNFINRKWGILCLTDVCIPKRSEIRSIAMKMAT